MPNPAAPAAHKEAQAIYAQMGDLQSREAAILAAMHANPGGPDMKVELLRLTKEWHELWARQHAAMAAYTEALTATRPH